MNGVLIFAQTTDDGTDDKSVATLSNGQTLEVEAKFIGKVPDLVKRVFGWKRFVVTNDGGSLDILSVDIHATEGDAALSGADLTGVDDGAEFKFQLAGVGSAGVINWQIEYTVKEII